MHITVQCIDSQNICALIVCNFYGWVNTKRIMNKCFLWLIWRIFAVVLTLLQRFFAYLFAEIIGWVFNLLVGIFGPGGYWVAANPDLGMSVSNTTYQDVRLI